MAGPTPTSDGAFNASAVAGGSTSTDSGAVDIFGTGKIGDQKVLSGIDRHQSSDSSMSAAQMAQLRDMEPSYPTSGKMGLYHKHTVVNPVQSKVKDLIKDLIGKATGNPAQRTEFLATQKKLFEAGLYGTDKPENVVWGSWTQDTQKAALQWYTAAAQENSVGSTQTMSEWLDQAATNNVQSQLAFNGQKDYGLTSTGSGSSEPQIVNHFTDPQVVAAYTQQAAQSALGRNLSNKELREFVDSFHKMETGYNKAANNNDAASVDLTQPDASAQAQQFVQQKHPNEVAGETMAGFVGALQSMLGGSA